MKVKFWLFTAAVLFVYCASTIAQSQSNELNCALWSQSWFTIDTKRVYLLGFWEGVKTAAGVNNLENADQLIYRVWPRGNGVPQVLALIDHHCSFQKNKNDSMLEAILKITNGPKP